MAQEIFYLVRERLEEVFRLVEEMQEAGKTPNNSRTRPFNVATDLVARILFCQYEMFNVHELIQSCFPGKTGAFRNDTHSMCGTLANI